MSGNTIKLEVSLKTLEKLINQWNVLSLKLDNNAIVQKTTEIAKKLNENKTLQLGEKIRIMHNAIEYAKASIMLKTVFEKTKQIYGTVQQKQATPAGRREGKIRLKVMKLI